ncbi:hypothetical protein [Streptomyces sp. ME19-01-6]|uniref:hypothetical protein n=1 Tax=Streptomyces sp. ME19-01-6 TaxID=3028686 RepID=UPI0029A2E1A9|nr:hypothetical protein [Streptomyces sp. ME19-01-6]MDX3232008.1 hypothetical protein [Streptomyces sp. ME19-01-6]
MAVLVVADAGLPDRVRDVGRKPPVGEERALDIAHAADAEETVPRVVVPAEPEVQQVGLDLLASVRRAALDGAVDVRPHETRP